MAGSVLKAPEVEEVVWKPQDREDGSPGPQAALLACPCDLIGFGGARGGGKSDGLLGDWIGHINEGGPKCKGLILRASLTELEQLIARSIEIFGRIGGAYNSSKKRWVFPDGQVLKFAYLERITDVKRYQGHDYTWIAVEEGGNWPTDLDEDGKPTQNAIKMLRATLRSAAGVKTRMVITANPGGPGHDWFKEWFIKPAPPMTPFQHPIFSTPTTPCWTVFIPSRLEDNRILMQKDPDYEAKLMTSGPAWLVRAWRFGDWDATPEGAIIKIEQLGRFELSENRAEMPAFKEVWDCWDTAFKIKQQNDYSVGMKFGVTDTGIYLLHCWRGKKEYPQLKQVIADFAAPSSTWNRANEVNIEDAASGQDLIAELKQTTSLPVKPFKRKGKDKVEAANLVTHVISAGKVKIPKTAPWLADVMSEWSIFPNGSHDDAVDAFVMGLQRFLFGTSHAGLMAFMRDQVATMKAEEEERQRTGRK
jgi:predicted phage terminase large subunit-like protein